MKLTGEKKKLMDETEVRFNGDFNLKNGFPTTYEGAIDTYAELSSKFFPMHSKWHNGG